MKHSLKILLVDNEQDILDLFGLLFTMDGAEVGYALNYNEALDQLEAAPYDIVVTDYRMPGMHGLYLLDMVKDRFPDMPVIIITAYPTEEMKSEARKMKADLVLTKGFEYNELLSGIRKLMRRKWKTGD